MDGEGWSEGINTDENDLNGGGGGGGNVVRQFQGPKK